MKITAGKSIILKEAPLPDLVWFYEAEPMIVNTITEAKANLSLLIAKVLQGETVIINRAGKPVAVLNKYAPPQVRREPGALKVEIEISEDFDELPSEIAESFGITEI